MSSQDPQTGTRQANTGRGTFPQYFAPEAK
jgi:hypothetical protein